MASIDGTLRNLLVALNAAPLPRATICRLGGEIERWAGGAEPETLAPALGVPPSAVRTALELRAGAAGIAGREAAAARALGARIVVRGEAAYPAALENLALPPPVLSVRGNLDDAPAVAIVGTRAPDPYGREAARFFGEEIARWGVTVVSGFARGVDEIAHRGALGAGGRTVAVLGCGLDVDYPRGRRDLSRAIAARGAVVSEFPLGAHPRKENFPVRNRIIAALGGSTLVIQATPRSGSLITARLALDLGREVFALPGRIFDERSLGPNALLRDGARLALHPRDLLDEVVPALATGGEAEEEPPPLAGLPGQLWQLLAKGKPKPPELLSRRLELPLERVLAALLELELAGWAERFPGPVYCRRRARM